MPFGRGYSIPTPGRPFPSGRGYKHLADLCHQAEVTGYQHNVDLLPSGGVYQLKADLCHQAEVTGYRHHVDLYHQAGVTNTRQTFAIR